MTPTRRRWIVAGVVVAALTAAGASAWPGIREAIRNNAEDREVAARAAKVCPSSRQPATVLPPANEPLPPFVANGFAFVSYGRAGRVSIVSLMTGEVTDLPAGVANAHEVAVSPDGRWAVAADFGNYLGNYEFDGRRLAVFDLAAKRLARVIDLGEHRGPHDVVFLPGSPSRAMVTTQTTRNVVEIDVGTGQVLGATPTSAAGSHTMAIAADQRAAFTANEPEGTVSRLDLVSRVFIAKHTGGPAPAEGIAVTPDGREVWVGFRKVGEVRVLDAATGSSLHVFSGFVVPDRIAISSDGRRAVVTDWACQVVKVFDVGSRRLTGAIAGLEQAGVAKILPDSRLAIVALLRAGAIAIVDLQEHRVLRRYELRTPLDAAAWGPDPQALGADADRAVPATTDSPEK